MGVERNYVKKIPVVLLVVLLFFFAVINRAYAQTTDKIIVKFKKPPTVSVLSEINRTKGDIVTLSGSIAGSSAMVYTVKNKPVSEVIKELKNNENVEAVARNVKFQKIAMPSDPYLLATPAPNKPRPQWNMYNLKLAGTNTTTDPGAWDLTVGSPNVVVAVLDDGVSSAHTDFKNTDSSSKFHSLVDCTRENGCRTVDSMLSDGHGSHVAGLVAAATNNAKGIAGAGYNTKIMMIKIEDTTGILLQYALNALQYAADNSSNGVKVVNMSFGVLEENIDSDEKSLLQDKINRVWEKGILPIAAAGNCGGDTDGDEDCKIADSTPSQYAHNSKYYPGALNNVIAVAATTYYGTLASYSEHNDSSDSNIGNWISVSAPGGSCSGEADKEYCILSLSRSYVGTLPYAYMAGTSMASPQVAGVAALLFAVNSNFSNTQVRDIILNSANSSIASGATLKGGVDALAAVRLAQGGTIYPTTTPAGPTATPTVTPTAGPTGTPTLTPTPTVTPYPTTGVAKLPRILPDPYPTGIICPNIALCPKKILGDADCNGVIDAADMSKWNQYYDKIIISAPTGVPVGNPNFYCLESYREMHFIDMLDYEVWRRNFLR